MSNKGFFNTVKWVATPHRLEGVAHQSYFINLVANVLKVATNGETKHEVNIKDYLYNMLDDKTMVVNETRATIRLLRQLGFMVHFDESKNKNVIDWSQSSYDNSFAEMTKQFVDLKSVSHKILVVLAKTLIEIATSDNPVRNVTIEFDDTSFDFNQIKQVGIQSISVQMYSDKLSLTVFPFHDDELVEDVHEQDDKSTTIGYCECCDDEYPSDQLNEGLCVHCYDNREMCDYCGYYHTDNGLCSICGYCDLCCECFE